MDIEYTTDYPVTVNDAAAVDLGLSAAGALFGDPATLRLPNPIMGSEDFSRVIQQVPGAMLFLGALTDDRDPMSAPSNHSPLAMFDDRTLPDGAALYATLAVRSLQR